MDARGVGRRAHAPRGAGKERITKMTAQLVEDAAGSCLRHSQAFGGEGDVLRLVDLHKDAQPVGIQFRHEALYLEMEYKLYRGAPFRDSKRVRHSYRNERR